MTAAEFYDSSGIKSERVRSTRAETNTRRRRVFEIVEEDRPMTVRQVYYQAVVLGLIGKTEQDYLKIQNDLTELRRGEKLPYDWLIDEGRRPRKVHTVEGIVQALNDTRRGYRKDPWQEIDEYVQIWVEKNALAGVIEPITDEYDVALMAAVGYSSITFAYEAAQVMKDLEHPIYVYHFGDYDPSGVDAARAIEKELRLHAPKADIHFDRVAVTPEQIREYRAVLAQPVRPLIDAMGGSAAVGRAFKASRRAVADWSAGNTPWWTTRVLRHEAMLRGLTEVEEFLAARLAVKERARLAHNYICTAVLFGLRGRWYLPDCTKNGSLAAPPPPPESLSDAQAATVNRLIAPRGWVLVKGDRGVWFPCRTI